jgi:hypothetical protein
MYSPLTVSLVVKEVTLGGRLGVGEGDMEHAAAG